MMELSLNYRYIFLVVFAAAQICESMLAHLHHQFPWPLWLQHHYVLYWCHHIQVMQKKRERKTEDIINRPMCMMCIMGFMIKKIA